LIDLATRVETMNRVVQVLASKTVAEQT